MYLCHCFSYFQDLNKNAKSVFVVWCIKNLLLDTPNTVPNEERGSNTVYMGPGSISTSTPGTSNSVAAAWILCPRQANQE